MKITDEIQRIARQAADEINGGASAYLVTVGAIHTAISAAPAVGAKAIEWNEVASCNGLLRGETPIGEYYIGAGNIVRLGMKPVTKRLADQEAAKAAAQSDYEARIRAAIYPAGVETETPAPTPPPSSHLNGLLDAAREVIACASDTYKKRNGHLASFEDGSGEKCWIVPFDAFEGLRAAVEALATEGKA